MVDKNKNLQHSQNVGQPGDNNQHPVYYTPNGPKALLPIDLMRANNTAPLQQPDKLASKIPLQLPLNNTTTGTVINNCSASNNQHQSALQHGHVPRKTVIQVSIKIDCLSSLAYCAAPPRYAGAGLSLYDERRRGLDLKI